MIVRGVVLTTALLLLAAGFAAGQYAPTLSGPFRGLDATGMQIELTDTLTGESRRGMGGIAWDCSENSVSMDFPDRWLHAPQGVDARVVLWLGFLVRRQPSWERPRLASFCSNFDPKTLGITDTSNLEDVLDKIRAAGKQISGSWETASGGVVVVRAQGSLLRGEHFFEARLPGFTPAGVAGSQAVIEREAGAWVLLDASDTAAKKYELEGSGLRFVVNNSGSETLVVTGGTFILGTSFSDKERGLIIEGKRYWYGSPLSTPGGAARFTILPNGKISWVRKPKQLAESSAP
jgi:hypothetical protein